MGKTLGDLLSEGYIPLANLDDVKAMDGTNNHTFASGTPHEKALGSGEYGLGPNYVLVGDIVLDDSYTPHDKFTGNLVGSGHVVIGDGQSLFNEVSGGLFDIVLEGVNTENLSKRESSNNGNDSSDNQSPSSNSKTYIQEDNGITQATPISFNKGFCEFAFDNNEATSCTGYGTVTWEGNLTNRPVEIVYSRDWTRASESIFIEVLNNNNQAIPFELANTNQLVDNIRHLVAGSISKRSVRIIIPEEATQIRFRGSSVSPPTIYLIKDFPDKELPNPVTNVTSEISNTNVKLSWSAPTNKEIDRYAIYRDGVFIGFSETTEYYDPSLYSDTDYKYSIRAIDTTGNRSLIVHHEIRTLRPDIAWRGLPPQVFDGNENTTFTGFGTATWDGDLANRPVQITYGRQSHHSTLTIEVLNSSNQAIPFELANSNQLVNNIRHSHGTMFSKTNVQIIIPEGATQIRFSGSENPPIIYSIRDL